MKAFRRQFQRTALRDKDNQPVNNRDTTVSELYHKKQRIVVWIYKLPHAISRYK